MTGHPVDTRGDECVRPGEGVGQLFIPELADSKKLEQTVMPTAGDEQKKAPKTPPKKSK